MSLDYMKARFMAVEHHCEQKYGELDYFSYHLIGVVGSMERCHLDDQYLIVGYLHDILEDTDCTEDEILKSFNQEVLDAVIALTKGYYGEESRRDYLARVAKNKIATMVKYHDISFNMHNCLKEGRTAKALRYTADLQKLIEFSKEETN